ncbi:MAG: hypothetical protein QM639_04930 [Rhodocyclaceae bacterium]
MRLRPHPRCHWIAWFALLIQLWLPVAHAAMPVRPMQAALCGEGAHHGTPANAETPNCPLCSGLAHAPSLPTTHEVSQPLPPASTGVFIARATPGISITPRTALARAPPAPP